MSQSRTSLGRILILQSSTAEWASWAQALRDVAEVQVAPDMEAVLHALHRDRIDWILGPSSQLVDRHQTATMPLLAATLDTISQGVCIVDSEGRIHWCNARFKQFPDEVWSRIRQAFFEGRPVGESPLETGRLRSLSFDIDNDRYYDVAVTPMCDLNEGQTRLVVVVSDVSRARRLQRKMDAIDNAGRELVRFDLDQISRMGVAQRLALLEQRILRCTQELLHFDNFIIRLLNKSTNRLEAVLSAGLPPEALDIDIYASTENNGITGYVAATGRSYICPDVRNDRRYLRGIDGARSSLTVPLWLHDHVIGVFNIESQGVSAFSEDDRQFAEIFGRYIALALHIMDVLVVERHTITGRLADNVSSEIAGPLNDILSDASTLMEDYIGHDDLRRRLQSIIDNVAQIKVSIKEVTRPEGGILGSRPRQPKADPALAGKSVLVIDDEEIIRQTVHDVLVKHGCEVEMVRDGTAALAVIGQRAYDLVLSDIRMPGLNGYEVFRAVKDRHPGCPVVFMTGFGYDPNHSIVRAHPEGLSGVLYKPFKVEELIKTVRTAIEKAGTQAG